VRVPAAVKTTELKIRQQESLARAGCFLQLQFNFSEQPAPRDPPTAGEYSGDAQPIQWRTQEQGDVHGGSPAKDGYPAVAEDYEGADHTKNDKQELQKEHL
jgi:hypothetical protein